VVPSETRSIRSVLESSSTVIMGLTAVYGSAEGSRGTERGRARCDREGGRKKCE
jgi:hypothetical protein